jgi:hypothetical protein
MTSSDGTEAMIDALRATGPRPDLADKLQLFGQFVGSWDLDRTSFAPVGQTDEGDSLRWVFSDISADAIRWRSEASPDGGMTWRLTVEMRVRRRR